MSTGLRSVFTSMAGQNTQRFRLKDLHYEILGFTYGKVGFVPVDPNMYAQDPWPLTFVKLQSIWTWAASPLLLFSKR